MSILMVPGDHIDRNGDVIIGPGIQQKVKSGELIPVHAGIFSNKKKKSSNYIFIESNFTKYVPQLNDFVIGTVTGSFGEFYRVEISGFSVPAILSFMAFPNASKKNRPNLTKGALIYARVSSVTVDIDTELECFDATTGKEGGFGLLEGGYMIDVRLGFARWLLFNKNNPVLETLSSFYKFEIAIGLNGKIWIKCDDLKTTLACSKVLEACQFVSYPEMAKEIKNILKDVGV